VEIDNITRILKKGKEAKVVERARNSIRSGMRKDEEG